MKRKKTVCEKALARKNTLLYVLLAVSFPICMFISASVLYNSYIRAIEPQLSRAAIEISRIIPELEQNSEHLQAFYDNFVEWQEQYSEAMHFDEADMKDVYIEPYVMGPAPDGLNTGTVFSNMIAGCVLSYQDVYIICGIGSMEILMGQMSTCILFIILWVFVRYAVMLVSRHEHSGKTLRSRLVACATIVSVLALLLTWYLQTMTELTSDLKTMEKHAKGAVEMLGSYDEMREDINQWLDKRYLTQCRFIAELLTKQFCRLACFFVHKN